MVRANGSAAGSAAARDRAPHSSGLPCGCQDPQSGAGGSTLCEPVGIATESLAEKLEAAGRILQKVLRWLRLRPPIVDPPTVEDLPAPPQPTDAQADLYELAYDEGIRGMEIQSASLDQLRVRMTWVLGTATTATAFLGGVVAKAGKADKDLVFWVGIVVGLVLYGYLMLLVVLMLRPTFEWGFRVSPRTIIDGYADDPIPATVPETHRTMALHFDRHIEENQENLNFMHKQLARALAVLIAEVACWAWLVIKVATP